MNFAHGETVTILHPGSSAEDDYGDTTTATWTAEDVAGCAVAPGASEENNRRQATVSVDFTVYMPAGTTVEPEARMMVRGDTDDDTYEVVGEPADWRSPFTGWRPGVVVELVRSQ